MQTLGVKSFFQHPEFLLENVQGAKEYLLDKGAKKLKKEKRQLEEEEKREILADSDWMMVKDLTQKNPGYALLFLRFVKEQKASKEILETLLDQIISNKDKLKQLPHDVLKYADVKGTEKDPRPGNEVLLDDLMILERKSKLKKFYNELGPKMKTAFERASKQQIDDLTIISKELDSLPEKDGKKAWSLFGKNLGRYENSRGYYPQFNNLEFAFETLIDDAKEFVDAWKISEDEYVKELKELSPQLEILYYKNKILAASSRTPEAQRKLQGILPWCIQYDSNFWNYAMGDRVQLVIIDSNRKKTDPLNSIGVTVENDGRIHAAFDANNHSIRNNKGNSYRNINELLKDKEYPESLIKAVDRKIGDESRIKHALMLFFKEEKKLSALDLIKGLLDLNKGFLKGQFSEEAWEKISGQISKIIFEIKDFKKKDFLKQFMDYGIYSDAAWKIWDELIGDDYTEQDLEKIYTKTKNSLEQMKDILELYDAGKLKELKADAISRMRGILDNKEETLEGFAKRMKK